MAADPPPVEASAEAPAGDPPDAEPTAASTAEPTAESTAEPAAEPVAEPGAEPLAAGGSGAAVPGGSQRVWRVARIVAGGVVTVLAVALVWFALTAPDKLILLTPRAFVRLPIEGLLLLALLLVLPPRARRIVAGVVGALLGLLTIVKILDVGFYEALDRPFNPVTDWGNVGPGVGVLRDSVGRTKTIFAVIAVVLLLLAIVVFTTLAAVRLSRLAAGHRLAAFRTVAALGVVWILCAITGVQLVPDTPVASRGAAALGYDQVSQVRAGLHDQQEFAKAAAADPYRATPGTDLLTGLRGKDVIVAFVESYGQVAVQDSSFSPQVDAVLDAGTSALNAAGFHSQSAFLTSPTFGGISWLAHSTLQSGLWINNQQRYNGLVASERLTLSGAFQRAGWRIVGDVPSNHQKWPEGTSFYHYDKIYDADNVGYAGPGFSYASMPDQYILAAYQRLELAQPHAPVMGEIDLVSSHTPWAPLPRLVDWASIGNGAVFDGMPALGASPTAVWRDPDQVRAAYGQSVQYSMNALISFVQNYHDDNLVLVVLGDHQPATIVSGADASHNVPISIIAHDPAVFDRIAGWGWQDGLLPSPSSPVLPMDAFRDRFLAAYGPQPPS